MSVRKWIRRRYPPRVTTTATCQHCCLDFTYEKTFRSRKYHRECAREVQLASMREKNAEYRRLHKIRLGKNNATTLPQIAN